MKSKIFISGLLIFLFFNFFVQANESRDGFVRLFINERNGSFQFLYLANNAQSEESEETEETNVNYIPLFYNSDPTTSYLSVNVNGRVHRLGRGRVFNTKFERINRNPAIVYESPFMIVNVIFSPVRTISSHNANGIKMSVEIKNITEEDMSVGLRFLLDTHLGEERGMIPFIINDTNITRETIIRNNSGNRYWISRNSEVSLMGNIVNIFDDNSKEPDYLHFANWKKFNDVPWNAPYRQGWRFNLLPYSINDSAVCYFWEPETLSGGGTFYYSVYLTTEDTAWYTWIPPAAARTVSPTINIEEIEQIASMEAIEGNDDRDIIMLRMLQDIIESFISGEIFLNEQDLIEIERSINRLQFNQ